MIIFYIKLAPYFIFNNIDLIFRKTKAPSLCLIIAFGDNFEAKKNLIQSSELHSDGLIALCANPEPMNPNNNTVRGWFQEAIERTELTADQQVMISESEIKGMGLF